MRSLETREAPEETESTLAPDGVGKRFLDDVRVTESDPVSFFAATVEGEATVYDFRRGIGLGGVGGFGEASSCCHLSKTEGFFPLDGGDLSVGDEAASSCELTLTMFCTNPRPCKRLRLGVSSFCCRVRKNAGDGFWEAGIRGACGEGLGLG